MATIRAFAVGTGLLALLLVASADCAQRKAARSPGKPLPGAPTLAESIARVRQRRAEPPKAPDPFEIASAFARHQSERPDLGYPDLVKQLGLRRADDAVLSFDPTRARHYREVARELQLTDAERSTFAKYGMVSVNHAQRYGMTSAYFSIWARELPVLITTDSILHALHRSYETMLTQLEGLVFIEALEDALRMLHSVIGMQLKSSPGEAVRTSLEDLDLYVTVARNLIGGAAASQEERVAWNRRLRVHSLAGQDALVFSLLGKISSLALETPEAGCADCTRIYGGVRPIDWSSFRPRGHYSINEKLAAYFRTLTWIGRPDLGFHLSEPARVSGLSVDATRERTTAALLALLLDRSGAEKRLQPMSQLVDFLVGRSDDLSPAEIRRALAESGITMVQELDGGPARQRFAASARRLKQPAIRGQVLGSSIFTPDETRPPLVAQLFGQRFSIDAFVMSKLVFDSILFHGEKQLRMMPSGLDVMAALGNDEAVALLEPELTKFNYASNLLAARRAVDDSPTGNWNASAYGVWLDALRTLDDPWPRDGYFPKALRTRAWQRKMLQTQLGSWAELRHDTILYGKQSYTGYPMCGYPDGWVEPYPAFFDRLEFLAESAARRVAATQIVGLPEIHDAQVAFFTGFAKTMARLEAMAVKELTDHDLSDEDVEFLKQAISLSDKPTCGAPIYDGWYPSLFYGDGAEEWKPTIVDVHTDPKSGSTLEAGVGDVTFLAVAIDEACGTSTYVGPAYSYYELTAPASQRMTDQEWQARLERDAFPPRPSWTAPFAPPALKRELGPPRRGGERAHLLWKFKQR